MTHVKIKFYLLRKGTPRKLFERPLTPLPDCQLYSLSNRKTFPEFSLNEPIDFFIDKLIEG